MARCPFAPWRPVSGSSGPHPGDAGVRTNRDSAQQIEKLPPLPHGVNAVGIPDYPRNIASLTLAA